MAFDAALSGLLIDEYQCTGERPQCSSCSERGIACVYTSVDKSETHIAVLKRQNEALRKQAEPMEELLNLLKEAPMEIAQMVFLKLRHGDAASVLRFMGGPLGYRQLSEQRAAREVLPSVQSELELELMVRYPVAYPVLAPVADDKLSSPARTGSNMSASKASSPNESSDTTNEMRPLKRQISDGDDKFYSHAGPKPPPQYIDPRLSALNMETWTNVSITNEFAAGAISLYLETDHPVLGLFDADLFVDSLVRGSREFCSPFLVSSLLAYASVSFVPIRRTNMCDPWGRSLFSVLKRQLSSKVTMQKTQTLLPKAMSSSVKLRRLRTRKYQLIPYLR